MLKPMLSILTALVLAPLAVLTAAEPPLVIILSGQSNMAGFGRAAELADEWRTPPPKVTLMNWGRAQVLGTGSIGPEVTLAHALARAMPGRQIVLFKAAHGGTSQLAWQPELDQARIDRLKLSHDQRVGHAYAQLIAAWKKNIPRRRHPTRRAALDAGRVRRPRARTGERLRAASHPPHRIAPT